jgi:hypothetical protein
VCVLANRIAKAFECLKIMSDSPHRDLINIKSYSVAQIKNLNEIKQLVRRDTNLISLSSEIKIPINFD